MQRAGSPNTRTAGPSRIPIALLDVLLSRELKAGPAEARRRARLVVSVCLGMFLVSVYMSAFAAAGGESVTASIANAGFTLVSLLLVFSLRVGIPIGVAATGWMSANDFRFSQSIEASEARYRGLAEHAGDVVAELAMRHSESGTGTRVTMELEISGLP